MIWGQPLTARTDWFITRNGESIKRVVWHLVLFVWSNRIRNCSFSQYLLQKMIFYEFMTTELFINKDVSKTYESLHDECI
jgi:hypothetical protein